jgi:hypothetical protein
MDFSVSNVNSVIDKLDIPLKGIGFIKGAVGNDIQLAIDQGAWASYSTEDKAKYVIQNVLSRTTGYAPYGNDFGTPPGFTINYTGWINKGLVLAIAAEVIKMFKVPYHTTLYKILSPLGIGWTVGGVFDPPPTPNTQFGASNYRAGSFTQSGMNPSTATTNSFMGDYA